MCAPNDFGTMDQCLSECELDFSREPEACKQSLAHLNACVGMLDCDGFDGWWNEIGDPYPCQTEDEAWWTCR